MYTQLLIYSWAKLLVPIFWLLWRMHLWIFVCKYLYGCLFSFLWGTYLGAELLYHGKYVSPLKELLDSFAKWLHHFSCTLSLLFLEGAHLLVYSYLIGIMRYLILVLICISLVTNTHILQTKYFTLKVVNWRQPRYLIFLLHAV